jgi:hypothetical protein
MGSESGPDGATSAEEINALKREEVDRQIGELEGLSLADKMRAVRDKERVLKEKGMNTDGMSPELIIQQFVNTESEGMQQKL